MKTPAQPSGDGPAQPGGADPAQSGAGDPAQPDKTSLACSENGIPVWAGPMSVQPPFPAFSLILHIFL